MNKLNKPNLPVVISSDKDVSTQPTTSATSFDTETVFASVAEHLTQMLNLSSEQLAKVDTIQLSVAPVIMYRFDVIVTPVK